MSNETVTIPNACNTFYDRWKAAKTQNPDALLFFRMGDFYELLGEDARVVARECELVLSVYSRGTEWEKPMCGVVRHTLDRYTNTLLSRGFNVAICEVHNGELSITVRSPGTPVPVVQKPSYEELLAMVKELAAWIPAAAATPSRKDVFALIARAEGRTP
jgi:hypothetical protein